MKYIADTSAETLESVSYKIQLVDKKTKPTPEQINECKQYADTDVDDGELDNWYVLLREAQGDISVYEKGLKYMIDNNDFVYDSLFCEWAYIINIDTGILEIYRGFNKNKNAKGRYAYKTVDKEKRYYGVELIEELPLIDIRVYTYNQIKDYCIQLEQKEEQKD